MNPGGAASKGKLFKSFRSGMLMIMGNKAFDPSVQTVSTNAAYALFVMEQQE